jgi:hypothetical protein
MTMCDAMTAAVNLAVRKGMGVYLMRDVSKGSGCFTASLFCDHCPAAVVGVVQPDGSFYGV